MAEKFGFDMSMAKINVSNQGTSPAQEPEDDDKLVHLLSPQPCKMLPKRHLLRVQHQHSPQ
eukprot:3957729-Prymnesium_polylepis.1